jgi:ArsR family transcriptional regulator
MIDIFKALSEESRLRIVTLLMEKEMCVCEIENCLNMTQSNVSRHLTELKRCGILESCKMAQWTYYQISDKFKEENKGLWEYLQSKITELPTYQADQEQCKKYSTVDLCSVSKDPH